VRHEKAEWILGFQVRRLLGRLARAMTNNLILKVYIEYIRQNLIRGIFFKPRITKI